MPVSNAYPGWLEREDIPSDQWSIQEGSPIRGDAWTDIDGKRMRVPLGNDELSRAVRFHEMVHAKVSPPRLVIPDAYSHLDPALVAACEEVRVNILAKHAGANVDMLEDGSEKRSAEIAVRSKNSSAIVNLMVSTYGTKVNNSVLRTIKKIAKEIGAPQCAELAVNVKQILVNSTRWVRNNPDHIRNYGSTEPHPMMINGEEAAIPSGYHHTLSLARELSGSGKQLLEMPEWMPGEEEGGDTMPVGASGQAFAIPIIKTLSLTERVAGRMGRKRIATDIGANPRRINRMLTDPERRIFDRRTRGLGGVVVIDQSGSMHLDTNEIWEIIQAAPGCTIIGYSHAPHSKDVPNIWVMAENGRVVKDVPRGNGGNGVDGPALLFGLSKRKKGEPFVWVCDGHVTGNGDDVHDSLTDACVRLVAKNNIHMTPDVMGAITALKNIDRGDKLPTTYTGPMRAYASRLANNQD